MTPSRRRIERIDLWLRWIGIAGLALIALWCCWRTIDGGWSPRSHDPYRFRNLEARPDWAYPTQQIATWVTTMVGEVLVLSLILRRARIGTATLYFLLAFPTGVVCLGSGILAMHASTPYVAHAVLLFLATAWLLAMAVVSGIAWLATRRRAAEQAAAPEEPETVEPPPARVVRASSAADQRRASARG